MTVVGTAYVQLQALGDKLGAEIPAQVAPGLKSVSSSITDTTARGRAAFGSLFNVLESNSNGALAPLANVAGAIGQVNSNLADGEKSAGQYGLALGAGVTAAGALLITLGDKDKIALQQLEQTVIHTGGSWAKYKTQIDAAIQSGVHYGINASDTETSLNKLALATHSPVLATQALTAAENVSAAQHISLTSAVRQVQTVYSGATGVLHRYGITTSQIEKPVEDLQTAELARRKALEALQAAQTSYNNILAEARKGTITQAQADTELTQAHEKVVDASNVLTTATLTVSQAHHAAATNAAVFTHNLDLLNHVTGGQAAAAANSFTGRLHAVGAELENVASTVGGKVGPALTVAGPILLALSTGFELAAGITTHFSAATRLAAASQSALAEAEAAQQAAADAAVAAQVALEESMSLNAAAADALAGSLDAVTVSEDAAASSASALDVALDANPIGIVVLALAALTAGLVEAYKHSQTFRDVVDDVGHDLKDVLVDPVHLAEDALHGVADAFDFVKSHIKDFLLLLGPVGLGIDEVIEIFEHLGTIVDDTEKVFDDVVHFVEGVPGDIEQGLGDLGSDVEGLFSDAWHGAENVTEDVVQDVLNFVEGIPDDILHLLENLGDDLDTLAYTVFEDFKTGIERADSDVLNFVEGIPGDILNGLEDLGSDLLNLGENILHSLLQGIENAAQDIPGEMEKIGGDILHSVTGFFGIHSPSTVMIGVGENITGGLAEGISNGQSAVNVAISNVTNSALDQIASFANSATAEVANGIAQTPHGYSLQASQHKNLNKIGEKVGKALSVGVPSTPGYKVPTFNVPDPSKDSSGSSSASAAAEKAKEDAKNRASALATLSQQLRDGFYKDLTGSASDIGSAVTKTLQDVVKAVDVGAISKTLADNLDETLKSARTTLKDDADSLAQVTDKLKNAESSLKSINSDIASYKSNIASSIESTGNITDLASTADLHTTIGGLQQAVTQAQNFGVEIKKLKKEGLNETDIDQILQSGVTSGGLTAQTLLTATPAQIAQINKLQAELKKSANSTGQFGADAMYSAGQKVAEGLVKGLEKSKDALRKTMDDLADELVKELKKKLKIHSPSDVFADLADNIPTGVALGVTRSTSKATDAVSDLAKKLHASGSLPLGTAVTSAGQADALLRKTRSSLAAHGYGGGGVPMVFIAGDLVVRSDADIKALGRTQVVAAQNIKRALG